MSCRFPSFQNDITLKLIYILFYTCHQNFKSFTRIRTTVKVYDFFSALEYRKRDPICAIQLLPYTGSDLTLTLISCWVLQFCFVHRVKSRLHCVNRSCLHNTWDFGMSWYFFNTPRGHCHSLWNLRNFSCFTVNCAPFRQMRTCIFLLFTSCLLYLFKFILLSIYLYYILTSLSLPSSLLSLSFLSS